MPPSSSLQAIVDILRKEKDAEHVLYVHAHARKCGLRACTSLGKCAATMVGEVGCTHDSKHILRTLAHPNDGSWEVLITGHAKCSMQEHAILSYEEMPNAGCSPPSGHAFIALLKACTMLKDMERGLELHAEINRLGLVERNHHIGTALVDMYAKFGLLSKAQQVFDRLTMHDTISWNALMTAYINCEQCKQVLRIFEKMNLEGVSKDIVTFLCGLKACGTIVAVDKGEEVHAEIESKGLFNNNVYIGSALITMYAKFDALSKARQVFNGLLSRNLVTWNSLIAGYAEHDHCEEALECLKQMELEGFTPNVTTLVSIVKACSSIGSIDKCQEIHSEIARKGFLENSFAGTSLVDMYAKQGLLAKAQEVFNKILVRNTVSWTALITGYAEQGHGEGAFRCYKQMQQEGIPPDATTLVCCLKACSSIHLINNGREVHAEIARLGLIGKDLTLANSVVDMYIKCGLLAQAQEIFDQLPARNVASWTSLIAGYAENGFGEEAIESFEYMLSDGVSPNIVSLLCSLKACASIGAVAKGQEVHEEIARKGFYADLIVGNALVDMYAKCGSLSKSRDVFDGLLGRDVVSWNALISGYAEHDDGEEALKCFKEMQLQGVSPDAVSFVCTLKACASIGAEDRGQEIHGEIARKGFLERSVIVGSTLVDMYAKCGLLPIAERVFEKLFVQDVVSWNSLIAGYVQLGDSHKVFITFQRMLKESVKPDLVTFLVVLNACSSTGLSHKSGTYFEAMTKDFGIFPALEHHSCVIDLLCRGGNLDKAVSAIMKMPFCPNLVVWNSMLSACKSWGNKELALQAFQKALCLDEKDSAAYVLVSHIFAEI